MNLREQFKKETKEELYFTFQEYSGASIEEHGFSEEYVEWLEKKLVNKTNDIHGYQPDKLGNCQCKNCIGQIEYYRFDLGIKKYGYDSEFRKAYQSMTAQLRHDELNEFFDEWDVPKN